MLLFSLENSWGTGFWPKNRVLQRSAYYRGPRITEARITEVRVLQRSAYYRGPRITEVRVLQRSAYYRGAYYSGLTVLCGWLAKVCCKRKQQDGWELLVCESWVVSRVEASKDGVVSCSSWFQRLSCLLF